jgi:hypothetical protein
MSIEEILQYRLSNQQLTKTNFSTPHDIVSWLGAVQAQDYGSAKWALSQRLNYLSDEKIEEAFNNGEILRTHVMRPTWHFVAPEDIRWLLKLTAPRVKHLMAHYNQKLGLTDEVFKKSQTVFRKVLNNKKALTREELAGELKQHGIHAKGQMLAHLVMEAELDAVICSGPRRGKQLTYMLLDERVAESKLLSSDESVAELTKRYFTSHGPATIKDFCWWSGLSIIEAKSGIESNKYIEHEVIDDKIYWFVKSTPHEILNETYLLPNYDEYTIAYTDRDAFFSSEYSKHLDVRGNAVFQHAIVYKGKITGLWKRTLKKNGVILEATFFNKPSKEEHDSFVKATNRYSKFLKLEVTITQQ